MVSPLCSLSSSTCTINFLSVRIEVHSTYGESKRKILFVLVMQFVFYVTCNGKKMKNCSDEWTLIFAFFFWSQPSSFIVSLDVLSLPRFEGKKRFSRCFFIFLVYNEAFIKDENMLILSFASGTWEVELRLWYI